jgi:hypothetical protein
MTEHMRTWPTEVTDVIASNRKKRISARRATTLLLLDAPDSRREANSPIVGNTRMQKLVFLAQDRAKENIREDSSFTFDYGFVPEKFGPADVGLYQDLEFLHATGLISLDGAEGPQFSEFPAPPEMYRRAHRASLLPEEREENELSFEYLMGAAPEELSEAEADTDTGTVYAITAKGRKKLKEIEAGLPEQRERDRFAYLRSVCQDVRRDFGDLPLKKLLQYVYRHHTDMTTRSTIKGWVEGHKY